MGKFDHIPERTMGLAGRAGDQLRQIVPPAAGKWFRAGARYGALRGSARAAGLFVRRHPVLLVAAAAGAGVLWYAAHRRARRAELEHRRSGDALEGRSRRVEARQVPPTMATAGGIGSTGAYGPDAARTPGSG